MIVEYLSCKNLHGYISKELSFKRDYSFIHGINGTGKTSLLKAMQSAIVPDIEWLYMNAFDTIEVRLTHERKKVSIRISKKEEEIRFSLRESPSRTWDSEIISVSQVEMAVKNSRRLAESEADLQEIARERIFSAFKESAIVRRIQLIPTPTFLGLDRTTNVEIVSDRLLYERRLRRMNPRTVGGENDLGQGLHQARELVRSHASQVSHKRATLLEKLRNEIAFSVFLTKKPNQTRRAIPEEKDIEEYIRMRDGLRKTLTAARYDEGYIRTRVTPFFDTLINNANYLKQFKDIDQAFKESSGSNINKLFSWLEIQSFLDSIHTYFQAIEEFNKKESTLNSTIRNYEGIINKFFGDSGKRVQITPTGEITISKSGQPVQLSTLSSGEKQILVLITQLAFNPHLSADNVLIIDEPELSLHVRWQEMFVDAVREVNPRTQMILATHAPSIILDRRDNLLSLDDA